MQDPQSIPMQEVIDAMLDDGNPFRPIYYYRLNGLSPIDTGLFASVWKSVSVQRRRAILVDMERFTEEDIMMSFRDICLITINDPDPEVRISSIKTLMLDESKQVDEMIIRMAESDEEMAVRLVAIEALGSYVYDGELDEIPEYRYKQILDLLILINTGTEHTQLQQRALESMGFAYDPKVIQLIEEAFALDDDDWITSALIAMGRSADVRWRDQVMSMLEHTHYSIKIEAVKAAGTLGIKTARLPLLALLSDEDDEMRAAAIWSLSFIGGKGVEEALETMLEYTEDVDETDLINDALENLHFNAGLEDLDLLSFSSDELEGAIYDFQPEDDIE